MNKQIFLLKTLLSVSPKILKQGILNVFHISLNHSKGEGQVKVLSKTKGQSKCQVKVLLKGKGQVKALSKGKG